MEGLIVLAILLAIFVMGIGYQVHILPKQGNARFMGIVVLASGEVRSKWSERNIKNQHRVNPKYFFIMIEEVVFLNYKQTEHLYWVQYENHMDTSQEYEALCGMLLVQILRQIEHKIDPSQELESFRKVLFTTSLKQIEHG